MVDQKDLNQIGDVLFVILDSRGYCMTNNRSYQEYQEGQAFRMPNEKEQKKIAIEGQQRLVDECIDPIQKERYKRGLEILKRE